MAVAEVDLEVPNISSTVNWNQFNFVDFVYNETNPAAEL